MQGFAEAVLEDYGDKLDERGRDYDVVYVGYNVDGHVGRLNLTGSTYGAFGQDRNNIFTDRPADIQAWFAAFEPSYDFDWIRVRGSALWASGDRNPYDNKETGFDAIYENPQFAGADTSYWIRQSIPFVGGGRAIGINGRNGVLADLRSSKDEGQSNFINPGTMLTNVGFDADVTQKLKFVGNFNFLQFVRTQSLDFLLQQQHVPRTIGYDAGAGVIYRPFLSDNIIIDGTRRRTGEAPMPMSTSRRRKRKIP